MTIPIPAIRIEIEVINPNLFELAAQYLGDATQWYRIASLNGLIDAWPEGFYRLKIPYSGNSNGGILV